MYVIWLPLIIKGYFRDKILDAWTTLLIRGSFGPLIIPTFSLLYWTRWMLMLAYPFTFYTANGIDRILSKTSQRWLKNTARAAMTATITMGALFMVSRPELSIYGQIPTILTYIQSSIQQNTIPLRDTEDTAKCLEWLNTNMNQNSTVIVHHAFLSWAKLYLDNNHTIIYYAMNITKAVEVAKQNGFIEIYLIWWNQNIGWYQNIKVPESFKPPIYTSGRIAIYTNA